MIMHVKIRVKGCILAINWLNTIGTMTRILILLAFCSFAAATGNFHVRHEFLRFKSIHNKTYEHPKEEARRFNIFARNFKKIIEHNKKADAGLQTYWKGVNAFTDMEFSEFAEKYLGVIPSPWYPAPLIHNSRETENLPKSVDWREKGIVSEIKDQGTCGSCWAFSTTASVEGAHAQATGKLVSLSEQNLMDCSTAEKNKGCSGGLMDNAFSYIIKNHGIDTEASYPYTAKNGKCHFNASAVGATISSYADIPSGDENALLNAAAKGVVAVSIHAGDDLKAYSHGIFNERICSPFILILNHGVNVVGYGTEGSDDYWIVRNSWGKAWGEQGYVRFMRGKNLCGIANRASYPIV